MCPCPVYSACSLSNSSNCIVITSARFVYNLNASHPFDCKDSVLVAQVAVAKHTQRITDRFNLHRSDRTHTFRTVAFRVAEVYDLVITDSLSQ